MIDQTSITNMTDKIYYRDFRIDELNKKRKVFGNDVTKIKRNVKALENIQKPSRDWFRR